MDNLNNKNKSLCYWIPDHCSFFLTDYKRDVDMFKNEDYNTNYIIFCQEGSICFTSNLFQEITLYMGEILFLPRMVDCQRRVLKDSRIVVHTFNNTVCRPEECILNYLYSHKKKQDNSENMLLCYKLSANKAIFTFMQSICHYIEDGIANLFLWHLKHKEFMRLFSHYYKIDELQAFFYQMTSDSIPFKSLVLSHYQKAGNTQELADLCGYGITTFRRIFKEEFGISVYQWLIEKRSEHILYRLSFPYIPFKDIMEEFNFSSPQQFNRFCKTNLGDSPTNLRKKQQGTE